MTQAIAGHYELAQEQIAQGKWTVDPELGLIFGVKGQAFRRRNSWGYVQIKFRHPQDWTVEVAVLAHRVIWEHVHGAVAPELTINHLNGVKTDNRLTNLEAVTQGENMRHAVREGLARAPRGEAHTCAVLTADQALTIYQRATNGEVMDRIAADFGVGRSQVGNIKCGLAWRSVTGASAPTPA